ncbi:MAG: 30S ribosomal protein S21 [Desulfuromonadales bacterium]
MQVKVFNDDVTKATKVLKRKLQEEGLFRDMKRRRFYEKPGDRRRRKEKEAQRRLNKRIRKIASFRR